MTTTDGLGIVKRYYTEPDLAEGFGVSRRTIARWRQRQALGCLYLPGAQQIRFLARHIWEFEKQIEVRAKRDRGRPRKLLVMLTGFLWLMLHWWPEY